LTLKLEHRFGESKKFLSQDTELVELSYSA